VLKNCKLKHSTLEAVGTEEILKKSVVFFEVSACKLKEFFEKIFCLQYIKSVIKPSYILGLKN